jgi:methylated-DNA-[protein]-cysteine S-methyltransferase
MSRQTEKTSTLIYESPIGTICCLFEGSALTGLSWQASPEKMTGIMSSHDPFRRELDAYFRGDLRTFTQEIALTGGTAFQRAVWAALRAIPFGEVRSYRRLAAYLGRPRASRAVGQALRRNPLPLALPCHRVISSKGSLGGFSCGIARKEWLLAHEAASLARTLADRSKV